MYATAYIILDVFECHFYIKEHMRIAGAHLVMKQHDDLLT